MNPLYTCCLGWQDTEFLLCERNRNNFLFLGKRILPFRDFTCLGPQAAYMIIKLAWLDMMLFAPDFIRKTAGTALMNNI